MLVHQADHQLRVAGLRDQPAFPARVGKIVERIRRFFFLDVFGIPGADKKDQLGVPKKFASVGPTDPQELPPP
jgi:hypothetical protein